MGLRDTCLLQPAGSLLGNSLHPGPREVLGINTSQPRGATGSNRRRCNLCPAWWCRPAWAAGQAAQCKCSCSLGKEGNQGESQEKLRTGTTAQMPWVSAWFGRVGNTEKSSLPLLCSVLCPPPPHCQVHFVPKCPLIHPGSGCCCSLEAVLWKSLGSS